MTRTKTRESGGSRIVTCIWPTISQRIAQRISDAAIGIRYPAITIGSIQVTLQATPDGVDRVEINRMTANRVRIVGQRNLWLDHLRDATRPRREEHDAVGD